MSINYLFMLLLATFIDEAGKFVSLLHFPVNVYPDRLPDKLLLTPRFSIQVMFLEKSKLRHCCVSVPFLLLYIVMGWTQVSLKSVCRVWISPFSGRWKAKALHEGEQNIWLSVWPCYILKAQDPHASSVLSVSLLFSVLCSEQLGTGQRKRGRLIRGYLIHTASMNSGEMYPSQSFMALIKKAEYAMFFSVHCGPWCQICDYSKKLK